MQFKGKATVYGANGTVAYDGTAVAVIVETADGSQEADVNELQDGDGELQGAAISQRRDVLDLTLMARSSSRDGAKAALAYPEPWSRVVLTGFIESTVPSLKINGSYVYKSGAKRTQVRGEASIKLQIFAPYHETGANAGVRFTDAEITTLTTVIT